MEKKNILKSKTFWAGIIVLVTGIGGYFTGEANLQELIQSGIGLVMIVLRFYTGTPVK